MTHSDTGAAILQGRTSLGIEFGSTRIKLVLMGEDHRILASGSHQWHSRYEDGLWTYSLEELRPSGRLRRPGPLRAGAVRPAPGDRGLHRR